MPKKNLSLGLLFFSSAVFFLNACSKNSDVSPAAAYEADLTDGVRVGSTTSTSVSVMGAIRSGSGQSLGKTSAAGAKVLRVLNQDSEVYWVGETTNYVIAAGEFKNFKHDDADTEKTCRLIAFKKKKQKQKVYCLTENQVGSFVAEIGESNAHYAKVGIRTHGTSVFFVDRTSSDSAVNAWTETDLETTELFSTTIESSMGLHEIFVHSAGAKICAMKPAISGFNGRMYCGQADGSGWAEITGFAGSVLAETLQVGDYAVTTSEKVSLSTFAVQSRTANGSNGGLPSGYGNRASMSDGGMVSRAYAGSISHLEADGDTFVLADFVSTGRYYQKLVGLGQYAWTFGTTGLYDSFGDRVHRISLTSPVWDSSNFIGNLGMTSVSDISLGADGRIRVQGQSSGSPAFAYIDSAGTIEISGVDYTPFSFLVTLQD